jgi:hypothetical protein
MDYAEEGESVDGTYLLSFAGAENRFLVACGIR